MDAREVLRILIDHDVPTDVHSMMLFLPGTRIMVDWNFEELMLLTQNTEEAITFQRAFNALVTRHRKEWDRCQEHPERETQQESTSP